MLNKLVNYEPVNNELIEYNNINKYLNQLIMNKFIKF